MAARKTAKKATKKKAARRKTTRKTSARKKLTVRKEKRGLEASEVVVSPDTPELAPLAAEVAEAGGAVIGAYREPFSGRPLLLASLPREAIEAACPGLAAFRRHRAAADPNRTLVNAWIDRVLSARRAIVRDYTRP